MTKDMKNGWHRGSLIAVTAGLAIAALVPASASASISTSVNGSKLTVVGDAYANDISVTDMTDPACPGGSPCYEVEVTYGSVVATVPCVIKPPPSSGTVLCPRSGIDAISLLGREGNDELLISEFAFGLAVPATLNGSDGDDELIGSKQADVLHGGNSTDRLQGRGGNDVLSGDEGDDRVLGQMGNDVLRGNAGSDILEGSSGRDRLIGGFGRDSLDGGTGVDLLFGGVGPDRLDGAPGRDRCDGGTQVDRGLHCEQQRRIP